ncbi:GspH/FimT family pseudopilin [Marichromatium bheemlicum]|uniref:Type II secretion system protein H n=1 Tax=Marichromatium bheemlicum TaxID=365339 RepID=A0ABX1I9Z5_9GAMM|nr:GspH/FimT family pseudopilin [Marichromatium bheemlicum]NKN33656.1 prepilin-type N-terminal cleavage/methylation domain-containing protein [Marichromatium bheemlicum]
MRIAPVPAIRLHRCSRPYRRPGGFTLIELLMTVAISAVVLMLGVPSFTSVIRNMQISTHTNDVLAALHLARSEAIKRGERVVVCKSADGASCTTSDGFEQGWIVFVDADDDATVDTDETVIAVHDGFAGQETLAGNTHVATYVSYVSDGTTQLIGGGFQAGTLSFSLCSTKGERNTIVISKTGRARVKKVTSSCN